MLLPKLKFVNEFCNLILYGINCEEIFNQILRCAAKLT